VTGLASQEQAHAWDLRASWASGREVIIVLEEGCRMPRVRGYVISVAATGAYVMIDDGVGEEWHVACSLILAVRTPHFHEDPRPSRGVRRREEPDPNQLSLLDVECYGPPQQELPV
jgi:predicted methyltransferase MtxX (methanogen marker protein 4)